MNKRMFLKHLTGVGALLGIGAGSAQTNPKSIKIYTADEIIDTEKLKTKYIEMANQEEDLRVRISVKEDDHGYYSRACSPEMTKVKFHLNGKEFEDPVYTVDEITGTLVYWNGDTDCAVSGKVEIINLLPSERLAIIDEQKNRISNYVS